MVEQFCVQRALCWQTISPTVGKTPHLQCWSLPERVWHSPRKCGQPGFIPFYLLCHQTFPQSQEPLQLWGREGTKALLANRRWGKQHGVSPSTPTHCQLTNHHPIGLFSLSAFCWDCRGWVKNFLLQWNNLNPFADLTSTIFPVLRGEDGMGVILLSIWFEQGVRLPGSFVWGPWEQMGERIGVFWANCWLDILRISLKTTSAKCFCHRSANEVFT